MTGTNKIRKNYRIEPELAAWVQKYARKVKLSETAVVELALRVLKGGVNGKARSAR